MKKEDSNFSFIEDDILRANLDLTFDLILKLTTILSDPKTVDVYTEELISSIRKQIIINTAAIIEALLLAILRTKTAEELSVTTKYFKIEKIIYATDDGKKIVLGEDKEKNERCKFDKLNLKQIIDLCEAYELVKDPILIEHLKKVKDLRNKQHLGMLKFVDNGYSQRELEFVFSVAKEVKDLARKKLSK